MERISRIAAYQVGLPLHEGSYNWSGGKSVQVFDSTIVRVEAASARPGLGVEPRMDVLGDPVVDVG